MWSKLKNLLKNTLTSNNDNQKQEKAFTGNLKKNEQMVKELFRKVDDIVYRHLVVTDNMNNQLHITAIYIEEMVDKQIINQDILKPLLDLQNNRASEDVLTGKNIAEKIGSKIINADEIKYIKTVENVASKLTAGNTILLIENTDIALGISTEGWKERGIKEPSVERAVRGPQESFTENSKVNIGLIRRRIQSHKLKTESLSKGRYSKTNITILYLEGVANNKIIKEVKNRVKNNIDVGQIYGCQQVLELIDDNPFSIFSTIYQTERPDTISAGILEGRVAIVTDGCPSALLVPKLFMENFISPEDYYTRYWYTSVIRTIRFVAFLISSLLPAFYVATLTYHQPIIPMVLASTIYNSREGVPFPIFFEMIIFGFFFEAIKEAGSRIPISLSSSITIVGALILGQSAVTAGFLSADGVIIGSITGIAAFLIPVVEFNYSLLFLRLLFIFGAAISGYLGITLLLIIVTLHLCSLRSFGVPIMSPVAPLQLQDLKDFFIRVPYMVMGQRPESVENINQDQQGNKPLRKYFFKYKVLDNEDEEGEN